MENNEFVYVTYMRTTQDNLWSAITKPEFARQYWGGMENVSDWKKGSKWQHVKGDKREAWVVGEVLECLPPKRLVLTWVDPDNEAEVSRVTFEIETIEDMVCLKVTHGDFKPGSDMPAKIAAGWPRVISSMKSFLETGHPLNVWAGMSHE